MEHLVNLSDEKKLVYIGPYLHKLKGALIMNIDPKDNLYITLPIIDEGWHVVDSQNRFYDAIEGFSHLVPGKEGDTVPIDNPPFREALYWVSQNIAPSPREMLDEASDNNLQYTDRYVHEGETRQIHGCIHLALEEQKYPTGSYLLTQKKEEYPSWYKLFPVPDYTLRFDIEKNLDDPAGRIWSVNGLTESIERLLHAYSLYFHRTDIRLVINCPKTLPAENRRQIQKLVRSVYKNIG